ncbi:MAG: prepilin-type N-terminal cleavage/methylation domain-containing protein [Lachnospiraceae bacterium]|nr:prepilin-type N-terminal cleavage/methylation domain-containing protein [Lachnospiraceae bacterium]
MKNKSQMNNKGFSLVEMIVTVLIMAIIAGAAIVAFASVYSTEVKAAAMKVADALKQARADAMALENENISHGAFQTTNVYSRFYIKDETLYIDICTDATETGEPKVLYSSKIGKNLKADFYTVSGGVASTDPIVSINSETDGTGSSALKTSAKIYFKKSTGGIAGIAKIENYTEEETGSDVTYEDLGNHVNLIKIVSTSNASLYKDMVLVDITGRCYIDE